LSNVGNEFSLFDSCKPDHQPCMQINLYVKKGSEPAAPNKIMHSIMGVLCELCNENSRMWKEESVPPNNFTEEEISYCQICEVIYKQVTSQYIKEELYNKVKEVKDSETKEWKEIGTYVIQNQVPITDNTLFARNHQELIEFPETRKCYMCNASAYKDDNWNYCDPCDNYIQVKLIPCEICDCEKGLHSFEFDPLTCSLTRFYWCELCKIETKSIEIDERLREVLEKRAQQRAIYDGVLFAKLTEFQEYDSYTNRYEETTTFLVAYGGDDFNYKDGEVCKKCPACRGERRVYKENNYSCSSCKLIFRKDQDY